MQPKLDRLLNEMPVLGPVWRRGKYPLKRILRYYLHSKNRRDWAPRIEDALACEDNRFIPRVPNAGKMVGGYLVMHNGLRIVPESYYGEPMRLLLEKNRGVHEPQEERVFMEVLRRLPGQAVMIELGAYWGFYSMWFHQHVAKPSCFLVEPHPRCLEFGQRNFAANHMKGRFFQAYAGKEPSVAPDGLPVICVDQFVRENSIDRTHIVHADIQGAELHMLEGARETLAARRIDYVFVSTHGRELHQGCRAFLEERQYRILADADLDETYSVDGLIVGRRVELAGADPVPIHKKQRDV